MTESKVGISCQTLVSNGVPASKIRQYIAALIVNIGGLSVGAVLAWTSPVKDRRSDYNFDISDEQFSWVGAFVAVGAMFGAGSGGAMVDMFGRKRSILLLSILNVISWLALMFAQSNFMLYLGRFFAGVANGGYSCAVPLYTTEMSEDSIRGTLGAFFQLQVTLGILIVYVLGSFLNVFWLTTACAIVPAVLFVLMMLMPESPIYYLKTLKQDEARRSLQWFRGSHYDVEPELQEKKQALDKMEAERVPVTQAFTTTPAKRGLVLGLGVMFFQQFSGINAVIFYASSIFKDAGSDMDANVSAIIIGVVQVIMTLVASLVIDKAGRRPLLLLSGAVMAISAAILGGYFYIKKISPETGATISMVPIISLSLFIVVFSLGFGPIPWMYVSEIFPPQIKGAACSIACLSNWVSVFFVTRFFSDLQAEFGTHGTFWIFAGISVAATFFVWSLLIETKGKSMEEIQKELGAGPSQMTAEVSMEAGQKPTKF